MTNDIIRVNFVCAGNICRSVMAENVARSYAEVMNLTSIEFSSSGTGAWHEGNEADPRTHRVLKDNKYPDFVHVARQYQDSWTDSTDLIVAMDQSNFTSLSTHPILARNRSKLLLLRDLDGKRFSDSRMKSNRDLDVPDPYFGDREGFETTLRIVERGVQELLDRIQNQTISVLSYKR